MAAFRQPALLGPQLLAFLLLAVAAQLAAAQLPPGAHPAVLNLPTGQFAHCAGSRTATYDAAGNVGETFGQGTVARLGNTIGIHYHPTREALFLGTNTVIMKVDKTCTMTKVAGNSETSNSPPYSGDVDGASPLFYWVIGITSLPNGLLVIGDYNCRLRTVHPETGYTAHFGPSTLGQFHGGPGCEGGFASGANTLGQAPANPGYMGIPRDLQYSRRDGRLYLATAGSGLSYSEVWSLSADGADVRVIFQKSDAVQALAVDPDEDVVYAATKTSKAVYRLSTVAPYTPSSVTPLATSVSGVETWKMVIVQNLAGAYWRLVPYVVNTYEALLDKSGAAVSSIGAPAEMCPSGPTVSCYVPGVAAAAEDGLIYALYGDNSGIAVYAYRAVPKASSIRLAGGAVIQNSGGIISIS